MTRFRSRLETVVKVRQRWKAEARAALFDAEAALRREHALLAKLIGEAEGARIHLRSHQSSAGAAELRLYQTFIRHREKAIHIQKGRVAAQTDICDAKRAALLRAAKSAEVVSKLVEKQKAAFLSMQKKAETARLDEIAGRSHRRR